MTEDEKEGTYCGQRAHQGRLTPREPGPGEGYALLRCGGTEVVLSYTVLHRLCGHVVMGAHGDPDVGQNGAVLRALRAITCEASCDQTPLFSPENPLYRAVRAVIPLDARESPGVVQPHPARGSDDTGAL
jgi:hypothetical protein